MKEKLKIIGLSEIVLINILFTLVFMLVFSSLCPDGLSGGECVKHKDNKLFFMQITLNLLFSIYYLIKIDKSKWKTFLINLLLMPIIYTIMAFFHSVSKAGFW